MAHARGVAVGAVQLCASSWAESDVLKVMLLVYRLSTMPNPSAVADDEIGEADGSAQKLTPLNMWRRG